MRAISAMVVAAAFTSGAPGVASALSAQDVLTYCLATHADPAFVREKLRGLGWTDVTPDLQERVATTLALGFVATDEISQRTSYSPSNWAESWSRAQDNAKSVLARKDGASSAILIEPETSTLIWIRSSDKAAISIHCLLVVTEAAAKPQSYHPKLQRPDGTEAFYTVLEGSDISASRINSGSMLVSVAPAVVEAALGVDTDVVAVFQTYNTYPASAVRP